MENVEDICFTKGRLLIPNREECDKFTIKNTAKNLLPTVIIVRYVFASLHIPLCCCTRAHTTHNSRTYYIMVSVHTEGE